MWLPKDERRLLTGFWHLIGDIDEEKRYRQGQLIRLLSGGESWKSVHENGHSDSSAGNPVDPNDMEQTKRQMKTLIDMLHRVDSANRRLAERGYIIIGKHQTADDVRIIRLTIYGFDLGRRYGNWWDSTGIWFETYRNHWIWLLVGFLGGIIGSLVVKLLSG
jgi:hypothetical protein